MLVTKYKPDNLDSLYFPSLCFIFKNIFYFLRWKHHSLLPSAGGHRGGTRGAVRARGVWDTRKTQPTQSTKRGSWGLTEGEEAIMETEWVHAKSSAYTFMVDGLVVFLGGNSWKCGCPWLFCLLLQPFSSYWVALARSDVRVCVSVLIVFWCALEGLLFSGEMGLGKRGAGRGKMSGVGKAAVCMYCMERRINKNYLFSSVPLLFLV